MFYSHEILTSPEHGVATIWLVATLGSKSIAKKLNKKAILDVDVPRACDVITNPEAPMALRLQGSLLYGVSRVFNQQCGYTLTDVQTMHDKMRAMLKVLPGGGLDPAAGKARPEQLILPDDPSFIPEINLPGLGIDFAKLSLDPEENATQQSSFLWPESPNLGQTLPRNFNLQLDLSSDDVMRDIGGFGSESGASGSVQRRGGPLGRISASAVDDEAGVLLQPDFEFDEDGNIIELSQERRATDVRDRAGGPRYMSETPLPGEMRDNDLSWNYQPMLIDDDGADRSRNDMAPTTRSSRPQPLFDIAPEDNVNPQEITTTLPSRRARVPRAVAIDDQTALRNTELAQINNEYVQNMVAVLKQKQQNRLPAQAKKNAAFWVFGQGIGSVGVGLGASNAKHPLHVFSGEELHAALLPEVKRKARKRGRRDGDGDGDGDEESGEDSDGRRVRARGGSEEQIGRGDGRVMNDDVEIARHASPALRDDNSSQMPWNITASIQSSRHGSSAAHIFRGIGNVSDFSSRGMSDSASMQLAGFGRPRSRLTSASPLAGRSFPFDLDALNALPDPGVEGENNVFGDFDLSHYMQTDVNGDGNVMVRGEGAPLSARTRARAGTNNGADNDDTQPRYTQDQLLQSSLDQESINFLDFMYAQIIDLPQQKKQQQSQEQEETARFSTPPHQTSGRAKEISFSALLEPKETTRTVATHGLMHILALATKGFVDVHQDDYQDQSSEERGTFYRFGEISVRLP